MKIYSKNVSVGTSKVNVNVTREQMLDIYNYDFYVHKKFIPKPICNEVIKIETYNENYYQVYINTFLNDRYLKLSKITKNKDVQEILDLVDMCKEHRMGFNELMEDELVQELSRSIDKEIIKNLINMKS